MLLQHAWTLLQVEKLIKELPSMLADLSNGDLNSAEKDHLSNGISFQHTENGTNPREAQSMLLERIASEMNWLKFYITHAQVPKGWDKLYVSLLSTETGKTVSKSGKASVWNGTCRWTETLSESVWISQDEAPKEFEQYLFKLVVSMGSARSSILGEATINLAGYMSSRASIPVSLPLKKCNHGTILQAAGTSSGMPPAVANINRQAAGCFGRFFTGDILI